MFQVKCQNGYEIHVIGKGENGLCRVANHDHQIVFTGTYAQCEKWLNDRAVKVISMKRQDS